MKITIEHDDICGGDQFKVTVDIKNNCSRTRTRLVIYAEATRKSEAIEKNIAEINSAIECLTEAKTKLGEL